MIAVHFPKVKKVPYKRMVIKNSFVTKDQNMKQISKRNKNSLVVATWNVHTLVECSGDERICRKQLMGVAKHGNHSDRPGNIDRKIDLLMGELRKYGDLLQGSKRQSGLEKMCGQWVYIPFCTLVVLCQGIRKELVGMRVLE